MIDQIELSLQGHQHSVLNLHPGFNVIIGKSDAGKSSILRGIRLVMDNRPLGLSGWVHHGLSALSVKLTLDDGTVERRAAFRMVKGVLKDATENAYIVDGQVLAAFGADVPILVRERLNLHPINIQRQHDGPFLVGETGGAVARYINEVVNLEAMDSSMANIASKKRENDQAIRVADAQVARLEDELKAFPDLESAEAYITTLEGMAARLEAVRVDEATVDGLIGQAVAIDEQLARATMPPGFDDRLTALEDRQARQVQVRFTADGLGVLLESLELIDDGIAGVGPCLEVGFLVRVDGLSGVQRGLDENRAIVGRLDLLLALVDRLDIQIPEALVLVQKYEQELKDRFGDVCPLCERPM